MAFTQFSGVGFSPTGLVVMPIVGGSALIGSWLIRRIETKRLLIGFLPSLCIIGIAIIAYAIEKKVDFPMWTRSGDPVLLAGALDITEKGLFTVLGNGWRLHIALFSLLAAAAIPLRPAYNKSIAALVLVYALLVLNPLTPDIASRFAHVLSWRLFWCIPFPLIIGILVSGLASTSPKIAGIHVGLIGVIILSVTFIFSNSHWTLSSKNNARIGTPGYKVYYTYKIAEEVCKISRTNDLVLAPWEVSAWLPTFSRHPKTLGVRPLHLPVVSRALGKNEALIRRNMIDFVSGIKSSDEMLLATINEIKSRNVTIIVTKKQVSSLNLLKKELRGLNYICQPIGSYEIWYRKVINQIDSY